MDHEERLKAIEAKLDILLAAWERFAPLVDKLSRNPILGRKLK